MRRALLLVILAITTTTSSAGCFVNMYWSEPIRRYRELFFQSEGLRLMQDDIDRFWMIDVPTQLTPKRYFGLSEPNARPIVGAKGPIESQPTLGPGQP